MLQIVRHYQTKECRVLRFFYCLIQIKEPCVRKLEGDKRFKILGILQTVFKTTRARQCFFSKRIHWNLSLPDIWSTWLAIRECRVGFPCFLSVNSELSRFLCKNNYLAKPDCSYFSNYKHQK